LTLWTICPRLLSTLITQPGDSEVSESTKAYRCHWKSGPFKGTREVAANSAEHAIEVCVREVIAEFHLPAASIVVTKVEAM
jgi:hypothetical protein